MWLQKEIGFRAVRLPPSALSWSSHHQPLRLLLTWHTLVSAEVISAVPRKKLVVFDSRDVVHGARERPASDLAKAGKLVHRGQWPIHQRPLSKWEGYCISWGIY